MQSSETVGTQQRRPEIDEQARSNGKAKDQVKHGRPHIRSAARMHKARPAKETKPRAR